ncbi:GTPase activating protein 1 [Zea mays]|uniref:RNA-metabolising metallo-beta-lactamase family protein n=2 Tax=Zea mays TaxID=4577 RepID=A0A1D6JBD3_MAIZE|nr:RNA-metabolising metallo-beta-lactamase family protein [Zea mays]AQK45211.1 RNA-metabolising metallo-beta-lactamase family protein [Zea mays]AQK45214.1 RNA-metabolising metallo-beta-lactamase family protein [Zea mays]AQK45220.1 RNA-metabolising metallo-beta-lactamase family protein [Zea mays]PWZ43839.1 GTPase activating protein 1 [Zea mays]
MENRDLGREFSGHGMRAGTKNRGELHGKPGARMPTAGEDAARPAKLAGKQRPTQGKVRAQSGPKKQESAATARGAAKKPAGKAAAPFAVYFVPSREPIPALPFATPAAQQERENMVGKKRGIISPLDHLAGLLEVRVVRGVDLAICDLRSSDPYVVLRIGKALGILNMLTGIDTSFTVTSKATDEEGDFAV